MDILFYVPPSGPATTTRPLAVHDTVVKAKPDQFGLLLTLEKLSGRAGRVGCFTFEGGFHLIENIIGKLVERYRLRSR